MAKQSARRNRAAPPSRRERLNIGPRWRKLQRLGQAHLAPGMSLQRWRDLLDLYDIGELLDAPDKRIDALAAEISEIVKKAKNGDPAKMKRESKRIDTLSARDLEAGQLEIVENGGAMFSPVELLALIQTRQIPIIEPGAWFDDRRLCAYAIDGDKIGSECCPNRGGNCCSLNGIPGQLCVFYEAREAAVWVAIRAYEGAR